MDRPLDAVELRRQREKRWLLVGAGCALGGVLILGLPRWLQPSISRARVRTALVDRGPIEATIAASGRVLPELERVITSPVDARVLKILRRAGAQLTPGEAILELDLSEPRLALARMSQDVALKQNQKAQAEIELAGRLADLAAQQRVKALAVAVARQQLERQRTLQREGLAAAEVVPQVELALAQAEAELGRVEGEARSARRLAEAQTQGLTLEIRTLESARRQAEEQLRLATTRADRKGVLTWVVSEEGALVRRGEIVARLADLSGFRVEATVWEVHARRLAAGLGVVVMAGEAKLDGTVANVLPTLKDGLATIQVALAERAHPALRANLSVDVLIRGERRANALRLSRGPGVSEEPQQELFVVRGSRAVRTPVRVGLASQDHCEILAGLAAGDEVIVSDLAGYERLREVRMR